MFVSAEGGLRLRSEPDLNGHRITTIPNNAEIRKLSETGAIVQVAEKSGKWVEIEYNKYRGWVFSGYLRKSEVASAKKPLQCSDPATDLPECKRRKAIERMQSAQLKATEAEPDVITYTGEFQFQDNWIQKQYGKYPIEKISGSLHVLVHNTRRDLGPVQILEEKGKLTWRKPLYIQHLLSEEISALHQSQFIVKLDINGYVVDLKQS